MTASEIRAEINRRLEWCGMSQLELVLDVLKAIFK